MAVYVKKIVCPAELDIIQTLIGNLQLALGRNCGVKMLMARDADPMPEIYIRLPNMQRLIDFAGFEQVERAALPERLISLVD